VSSNVAKVLRVSGNELATGDGTLTNDVSDAATIPCTQSRGLTHRLCCRRDASEPQAGVKCVRSGGGLFSPRPLWPRLLEPGGPVLPGTMATIGPSENQSRRAPPRPAWHRILDRLPSACSSGLNVTLEWSTFRGDCAVRLIHNLQVLADLSGPMRGGKEFAHRLRSFYRPAN
jgi:hypothetical protein